MVVRTGEFSLGKLDLNFAINFQVTGDIIIDLSKTTALVSIASICSFIECYHMAVFVCVCCFKPVSNNYIIMTLRKC